LLCSSDLYMLIASHLDSQSKALTSFTDNCSQFENQFLLLVYYCLLRSQQSTCHMSFPMWILTKQCDEQSGKGYPRCCFKSASFPSYSSYEFVGKVNNR
jgi:hypothetical protein